MFAKTLSKEEHAAMHKVMDRALKQYPTYPPMTLALDLLNAHDDVGLDFERLLAFEAFDFSHDITGICNHMDRSTGKLRHCFLPRCAKTGA